MATKKTVTKKVAAKKVAAPVTAKKTVTLKAGSTGKAVGRTTSSYVGIRGAHVTFEAEQGERFVIVRFTYAGKKATSSMSAARFLQNFEVAK